MEKIEKVQGLPLRNLDTLEDTFHTFHTVRETRDYDKTMAIISKYDIIIRHHTIYLNFIQFLQNEMR